METWPSKKLSLFYVFLLISSQFSETPQQTQENLLEGMKCVFLVSFLGFQTNSIGLELKMYFKLIKIDLEGLNCVFQVSF